MTAIKKTKVTAAPLRQKAVAAGDGINLSPLVVVADALHFGRVTTTEGTLTRHWHSGTTCMPPYGCMYQKVFCGRAGVEETLDRIRGTLQILDILQAGANRSVVGNRPLLGEVHQCLFAKVLPGGKNPAPRVVFSQNGAANFYVLVGEKPVMTLRVENSPAVTYELIGLVSGHWHDLDFVSHTH